MRGIIVVNGYHRYLHQAAVDSAVASLCRTADLRVYVTEFPGHARYIAERAAASGADVVVAVGGDGTLNEVVNGVAGTDTAATMLPVGTANDFARHMLVDRDHMCDLSACRTRYIDLIRVNNWHFLTVGGLGLACDTLARAERFKRSDSPASRLCRAAGSLAYLVALTSLAGTFSRSRAEVVVESDHGRLTCDPLTILIANQPSLGRVFTVAPAATNNDGRCDLFIINRTAHWSQMAWAVAQTCVPGWWEPSNIVRLKSSNLTIFCDRPLAFFGDGEIRLEGQRFHVEVMPRALRVLVPPSLSAARAYSARPSKRGTPHPVLRPVTIQRRGNI